MSVIFHIMKEEYDRLQEAERVYRASVAKAVRGAPRIKHIGNRDYLYLEKREASRVVYEYVGNVDSEKASAVLQSVKRRNKDRDSLRKVCSDLKDVKKVLRGKI